MNNKIEYTEQTLAVLKEFLIKDPTSEELKRLIRYIELGKGAIAKTIGQELSPKYNAYFNRQTTKERLKQTQELTNALLFDRQMTIREIAGLLKLSTDTIKNYKDGRTACKSHNLAKLKFLVKYLDLQGKKYSDLTYNELIILKGELQDAQTHEPTEGGSNG